MRVLQLLPMISARFGGPVVAVSGICESTGLLGVNSTIVATNLGQVPSSGEWRQVTEDEMPTNAAELDIRLFDFQAPKRLAFAPSMGKYLDKHVGEFDLVHIHSLWLYPQFAAQRAARRAGVPYLVSPRGALDPYLRQRGRPRKALTDALWQTRMLRNAARIHVTAQAEADLIDDIAPEVPRAVVPGGIWIDRAAKGVDSRFREMFLDDHRGEIVLFVGRISEKKGVDVLIRAFAIAVEAAPNAALVIVGPDDEGLQSPLEELAEGLGIRPKVHFVGALYGESKADALAAATVWALPSHSENFGNAVVEALAIGLPSVLSPQINIVDEIAPADAAVIAENHPEPFGEALRALLLDEARRAELSANASRFAQRYDWSAIAPRMLQMYKDCVEEAR